jgi:hypothetical protein
MYPTSTSQLHEGFPMCTWTESVREAFSSLLKQPAHGQHVPAPGCANALLVTTLPESGFG